MKCKILKDIDERIRNGEDPDTVIPWEYPINIDKESLIELLYYIVNHSRIPHRVESCKVKLKELEYASRTDGDISRK